MDIKKEQIYSHYKRPNRRYEIIAIGMNSETLEEMVVYKALYQGKYKFGQIWVRPRKIFEETVEFNGEKIPRFKLIDG